MVKEAERQLDEKALRHIQAPERMHGNRGIGYGNFSLGSFVWKLSPGIFRLIYSAWDVSLGNFRLGSFAWELSLRILRDLSLARSL